MEDVVGQRRRLGGQALNLGGGLAREDARSQDFGVELPGGVRVTAEGQGHMGDAEAGR